MSNESLLLTRQSHPKLVEPAPSGDDLIFIQEAALRVPDHARLHPWRFLTIEGEGLERLGAIYRDAAIANGVNDDAKLDKMANNPLRAPMIIVLIAKQIEHAKVPKWEQISSAACCGQNILLASQQRGFAAMWRTGEMAENKIVKTELGLSEDELILGFIYVGSPQGELKKPQVFDRKDYWQQWPA